MAVHVGGRGPNHLVRVGNFYPDATVALDFLSSRYRNGAGSGSTSEFALLPNLTVSRASVGYDLAGTVQFAANVARIVPGFGLLIEESRTNLFLNSFAPATQTVTITAASHTITVWGTGSVTVAAGTATISNGGAASSGAPRTIGCTVAGTITVTVSGSPSIVQVEAGISGTSPIPTTGATATRAADSIRIDGLSLSSATVVADLITPFAGSTAHNGIFDLSDGTVTTEVGLTGSGSGTWYAQMRLNGGVPTGDQPAGTLVTGARTKLALAYGPTSARVAVDGVLTSWGADSGLSSALIVSRLSVGINPPYGNPALNSYLRSLVVYPTRLSNAQLQALTQ